MALTTYRGDRRHDNSHNARRFRHQPAPDMPVGLFRWLGSSHYQVIIEAATCRFTVKAYTPGQCWRVFYKAADDLTCTELTRRFSFSIPATVMWLEMATAAYAQRIDDDRAADEASSPPPSLGCSDDVEIPW
jgi:hypothetical protein